MRISKMRTDPALEKSGAWVVWNGDARVRVRRLGNYEYRKAIAEALKPHRALIRAGALPEATMEAITTAAIARHVLVGWDGFQDDSDREIEYDFEIAVQLLSDPRYHDLYEFVLAAATRMENFRAEEKEDDLGNLLRSSNGHASSGPSRSSFASSPDRDSATGGKSKRSNGSRKSTQPSARRGARSPNSTIPSTA